MIASLLQPGEFWALCALLAWLLLCAACLRGQRQPVAASPAELLLAWASQSGNARQLAEQTARQLSQSGQTVQLLPLDQLDAARLQQARRALFFVSTYGDGEPPDNARRFSRQLLDQPLSLEHLDYAVVGLGDSRYPDYCAFAQRLDGWLQQTRARALQPLLDIDNMADSAIGRWREQLHGLFPALDHSSLITSPASPWQFVERRLLNPGSPGGQVWLIRLKPIAHKADWQAGDLLDLQVNGQRRSYSIANLPGDGLLELVVRLQLHADGRSGLGSGLLCMHARPGQRLEASLRSNPGFYPPDQPCPLILIGNGTGIAGLRALLKQRQQRNEHNNWLIWGERSQQHDLWFDDELCQWQRRNHLQLDRCFSRDPHGAEYVQQRLRRKASQLRIWLDNGAAIYLCGSLEGMGRAVDATLRELLGEHGLAQLQEQGRYRRDLY